jgi:hypothetical protein
MLSLTLCQETTVGIDDGAAAGTSGNANGLSEAVSWVPRGTTFPAPAFPGGAAFLAAPTAVLISPVRSARKAEFSRAVGRKRNTSPMGVPPATTL